MHEQLIKTHLRKFSRRHESFLRAFFLPDLFFGFRTVRSKLVRPRA